MFFCFVIVQLQQKGVAVHVYVHFCFCITLPGHIIMTEESFLSLKLFKSCLSLPMMEFFPSQKQNYTSLQTSCIDQLSGTIRNALYNFVHMYAGYVLYFM